MEPEARDIVLASLRGGRPPYEASKQARRACPAAVASLEPLLDFAAEQPALLEEVRRRVVAPESCPPDHREAAIAWRALFDEAGVSDLATTPTQRRLAPFLPPARIAPWPLVVAHPLAMLDAALGRAQNVGDPAWSHAMLLLRDAAEGVARTIWAALLWETFELQQQVKALADLPPPAQLALRDVAGTLAAGFTLGTVPWLAGKGGALASLAPEFEQRGLPLGTALHRDVRSWLSALTHFQEWRNSDLGHGLVGSEERLGSLFVERGPRKGAGPHEPRPFDDLLTLLAALAPWLAEVQRTFELWPNTGAPAPSGPRSPLTAPLAWTGGGELLWMIEGVRRREVVLRGIVTGRRENEPNTLALLDWIGLAAMSTGAATTSSGWLAGPRTDEQLAAAELEASRAEHQDVWAKALHAQVVAAVAGSTRVAVRGSPGTGKSRLLAQLVRDPKQAGFPEVVVLATRAQPGVPLTGARVASDLDQSARRARGLVLPDQGGGSLSAAPVEAIAWWKELAARNPRTTFLVVVDGVDEGGALHARESLGDVLPPEDLANVRAVVSYRSLADLEPTRREAMKAFDAFAVDLDAFYGTPAGDAVLRHYLKNRHPKVTGRLVDDVLKAASGRFLWVFHYARGVEIGLLDAGRPATWPTPGDFYRDYFAALEARAGHHAGYVGTLRDVLLTLAEAEVPLNDATLVELLVPDAGDLDPGDAPGSGAEFVLAWLRPVLYDLGDFLERRRVDVTSPAADLVGASHIVRDDVEAGDARAAFVRRIAHATLRDVLRDAPLAPDWETARVRVQVRLAARTAKTVDDWLALAERAPDPRLQASARYALLAWARHAHRADTTAAEVSTRAWELAQSLPEPRDVVHSGRLPAWRRVAEVSAETLDATDGATLVSRARIWRAIGEHALAARDVRGALEAHRKELTLKLVLAGLPEGATDDDLRAAVRDGRADALRSLAIAWANVGKAAQAARDVRGALEAHRKALTLKLVLAGLPEGATDDDLRAAVRDGRADALRSLAIAWANVGKAAQAARDRRGALEAHRRELALELVLAGLPEGATDDDLRAAVRDGRADALRSLAIALLSLGDAEVASDNAQGALPVFEESVRLNRAVLAGASGGTGAVRDVAIALHRLLQCAELARSPDDDARRRELLAFLEAPEHTAILEEDDFARLASRLRGAAGDP